MSALRGRSIEGQGLEMEQKLVLANLLRVERRAERII